VSAAVSTDGGEQEGDDIMNIGRILYPVKVLGPGQRLGIWTAGCGRNCPGCCSPELKYADPGREISVGMLRFLIWDIIKDNPVDGITISGGEPMDQAEELGDLISILKIWSDDILVYTGYTLEELKARKDPQTDRVLSQITCLIDGPFQENLSDCAPLRGSGNQRILLLDQKYGPKYRTYLESADRRDAQIFVTEDGIAMAGLPMKKPFD